MEFWSRIRDEFEDAELLTAKNDRADIEIKNRVLKEASVSCVEGTSLRVMKGGKLGSNFSMGEFPGSTERLLRGAGQSAGFGPQAAFSFSREKLERRAGAGGAGAGDLLDYLRGFLGFIEKKDASIPLNVRAVKNAEILTVRTARGGDCVESSRTYALHFSAPVPGGASEFSKSVFSRDFFSGFPEEEAEEFVSDYRGARAVSVPAGGRMPALFSPEALFLLVFCLQEGVSGKNLYLEISPLKDRRGERLFTGIIDISDEPLMEASPHSRVFDDEGVRAENRPIVSKGILENFICDLRYGAGLGGEPAGNGLKSSLFSSGVGTPVSPAFINPVIKPGSAKKADIVRSLKEAIIVENVLGFHSSNYTQGHFSVQAHGLHVVNGAVKGRLEDVMIAGNIYEDFRNAAALDERLRCTSFGHAPYMLVENIMVSGG